MQGLAGESPPPAPVTTDFVTPVQDDGPAGKPTETMVKPDPVDPETGKVLDLKPDESPLDLEKLYKTKLNVGDGETVTISQLKDMYTELTQVKTKASEHDQARDDFGREQLLARQEFDAMVALLPADAQTPEFRAAAQDRIKAHQAAETVKMLKVVPEWSDPQQAADDQRMINKHAAGYGFSAAEIGLISDHRMLKYLRDNARRELRLANVELTTPAPKAMTPTPAKGKRSKGEKFADIKSAAAKGEMSKRVAAGQVLAEALSKG